MTRRETDAAAAAAASIEFKVKVKMKPQSINLFQDNSKEEKKERDL